MGKRGRRARAAEARAAASAPVAPPQPALVPAFGPALLCAMGVAAAAAFVAFRTLAPTVTLVDSGELIVAARNLGVAHPPGSPLYLLLAHLATLPAVGNVAQRVNAASALCAAIAAGLLVLALREGLRGTRGADGEGEGGRSWTALAPLAMAGLLLAFSRTLWAYATVAEVYTLNTALLVGTFLLMLRWRSAPESDGPLLLAALVFGLGLGVHHLSLVLCLPAFGALVLGTTGRGFFASRRILEAAAVALAGVILVYAYLPWAASRAPVLNWGNPSTLQRIYWHVSGRQYQSFFELSASSIAEQARGFLQRAGREFGPAWFPAALLLALAGVLELRRRDPVLLASLAALLLADLGYGLVWVNAEDKDAYYLPAFVALALAAGFGAEGLLRRAATTRRAAVAAVLLALPLVPLVGHFRANDRSRFFVAEDYVSNVLDAVAPGGLLLTCDWQVYSPFLYSREVEGRRRDAVVLDVQLLRRPWYFDYLRQAFPGLISASQKEVDAFLEDLLAWERDPALYQRDLVRNKRISDRHFEMILSLVRKHPAPVYATRDVVLAPFGPDPELAGLLSRSYVLVPQGLVFELTADRAFQPPARIALRTRGLFDPSLPVDPEDVMALKVRPVYLGMIANRGVYLAAHGRHAEASAAFEEALALDPGFAPARDGLARSRSALDARTEKLPPRHGAHEERR